MNAREKAVREAANRKARVLYEDRRRSVEDFGKLTFNRTLMERLLPKKVSTNLLQALEGKGKVNPEYADTIALALKDWAIGMGATHFCHWFQPLTGYAAEKQDAFLDYKTEDTLVEKFSGKDLMRGEPDASSFPSGRLRSTFAARGYTTWDPSTPAFLWKSGGTTILCIPALFFSWTGKILDMKIPLLRSDAKMSAAAMRLLDHLGIEANQVFSTVGCEQEYFLIDRALFALRPDLLMGGRTVVGAAPPKSQEMEDHYFGILKERVLAYMKEFEDAAFALGIPVKTRHNEVAPAQHEVAPIFEKASIAVDHNVLLMEVMKQVAIRHDLACLLHEKPFAGINGSGKHNNWSLSTDSGLNLLDPTARPEESILFLIMVTAVLSAVHKNSALLRAAIASAGNDHRLGGHEAPPVIISVYLGEALDELLTNIEKEIKHERTGSISLDLGIPMLPDLRKDETDRNRTSPFAFTGNKFEFRAVGASANCALPVTVLNVIVAESLNEIVDEIEKKLSKKESSPKAFQQAALPIVRKYLKASRPIRFTGDNYSAAWEKEAKKRGLPIIKRSFYAFESFVSKESIKVFEGVLQASELKARHEVMVEQYSKVMNIEAKLVVEMARTQILPAAIQYQKEIAQSIHAVQQMSGGVSVKEQAALLRRLVKLIDLSLQSSQHLDERREKASDLPWEKSGKAFCDEIGPLSYALRKLLDEIETLVDDKLWPLPKYRELLNST